MTKLRQTRQMIDAAMADAQRPALALSGGKDSLLLLALCKPYRKRLHVVWARTSETFPHMVDFMREATRGWDFQELVSDQSAYFATHGFPSALIPVRHRPHEKNPGILIQSNGYCCKALQYKPLARYLKEYGTDLVLHGQTAEDLLNHKTSFPAMLSPLPRRRIVAPLRNWTAEEVLAYCQRRRVPLPEQYATGLADSLECWNCTVRIDLARFRWMQAHYPVLAEKLGALLGSVYGAAITDYETHIAPVLDAARNKEKDQKIKVATA
ncbi:phosphoadenosine phosphosulfate reductase family protein [Dentiradicibacter hellwigii]|uniref:Phosphoadenosine phosphosulfate reductase family protein n=1 Tax=Dentiradicibacter hellwigii TaxID=3149053 RepID=A0ABV4UI22_9RHOO